MYIVNPVVSYEGLDGKCDPAKTDPSVVLIVHSPPPLNFSCLICGAGGFLNTQCCVTQCYYTVVLAISSSSTATSSLFFTIP
jgi:hypothetical protein